MLLLSVIVEAFVMEHKDFLAFVLFEDTEVF